MLKEEQKEYLGVFKMYLKTLNEDRKKEGRDFSEMPKHGVINLYDKYPNLYKELKKGEMV